jgi:hypothetical protein
MSSRAFLFIRHIAWAFSRQPLPAGWEEAPAPHPTLTPVFPTFARTAAVTRDPFGHLPGQGARVTAAFFVPGQRPPLSGQSKALLRFALFPALSSLWSVPGTSSSPSAFSNFAQVVTFDVVCEGLFLCQAKLSCSS